MGLSDKLINDLENIKRFHDIDLVNYPLTNTKGIILGTSTITLEKIKKIKSLIEKHYEVVSLKIETNEEYKFDIRIEIK